MKTMIKTLTVAAGVLAVPFGAAVAENAVPETRAQLEAIWDGGTETSATSNGFMAMDQLETSLDAPVAVPDSVWADNYAAGRVHPLAGR